MSQHSQEHASDRVVPLPTTARIVPFERPQSELQKAVQQRAQESMARERDRANQRPAPWRRVLVLVLAAVPVLLTFGAALAFVGALRQFNSAVLNSAPQTPTETSQTSAPGVTQEGATPAPEVIMLKSFSTPTAAPKAQETTVSPPSR